MLGQTEKKHFYPCWVTPWSIELTYCELNEIVGIDMVKKFLQIQSSLAHGREEKQVSNNKTQFIM
jgi:hypothetical protein